MHDNFCQRFGALFKKTFIIHSTVQWNHIEHTVILMNNNLIYEEKIVITNMQNMYLM